MIRNIIEKIVHFSKQGKAFVLVTILQSSGSTPRIEGANMIVSHNGDIFGTIGGGLLEAKVTKYASEIVVKKKQASVMDIVLSPEESGGIGMICGGQLSIMLDPISVEKRIEIFFNSCLDIIKQGYKCKFLSVYGVNERSKEKTSHYLIYNKNILSESDTPNEEGVTLIRQYHTNFSDFSITNLDNYVIVCSPVYIPKLYIMGAGHVAQPTAAIAKIVGFSVVVMDDRRAFANAERFPDVETIKIVNFRDVFRDISIGSEAFIVIITRGHLYDSIVLEQALLTNVSYLGMIGSLKKRNSIFAELRQKEIKEEDIKRVHSPIGIDINSETPEEIALSIVAEMVLVRSGKPKNVDKLISY